MKTLRPSRTDEIKVLKYLRSYECPENHSPMELLYYYLGDSALLFTQYLGTPALSYRYLSRHLTSIVRQFLEGVAFMHSMSVAHKDLKSSHVIIDEDVKVWIIDYDLSEIIDDDNRIKAGFRGTKGWTAPEVGRRPYNPFLADIWATGKVIRQLCDKCVDHQDCAFLKIVCTKLMKRNPKKRITIQEALEQVQDITLAHR